MDNKKESIFDSAIALCAYNLRVFSGDKDWNWNWTMNSIIQPEKSLEIL